LARELALVARADQTNVSEAVRSAIRKHVDDRLADEEVQERCRQFIEKDAVLLKRLSGG
jgi:Arc/MetJ-type ribon-helix-helix transcriptional regulator